MSKGRRKPGGPVVLIVLDGWGQRTEASGNAIALGDTPVWAGLPSTCPTTLLDASGGRVGLPDGQMGNSEVGHLNLGAGRVVSQDIVRISESIRSSAFYQIPALTTLCDTVRQNDGTLHLIGLVGPGGVHALDKHWQAAMELARRRGLPRVALHAFLDGRDTLPTSALGYVEALAEVARDKSDGDTQCNIASAIGRYHAMDRDRRWDRTRLAYDAMVNGIGTPVSDAGVGIQAAYDRGETDEFIKPLVIHEGGRPVATISDGDGVLCLNFRADRMRQIVRALAIEDFKEMDLGTRPQISMTTMTEYDASFPLVSAFAPRSMSRIMAEVVSDADLTQFRTAETEKYAHVTYFFNGGIEIPYKGEERRLVDSQRVATYDLKPEMSAHGITDMLCQAIEARNHDFILCNYANGDMVGHTGVLSAAVKAVETVDLCLDRIFRSAERATATVAVTADHGNCEMMIDAASGSPHTAHTTNPVPFVLWGDDSTRRLRTGGALCDVAPTVLGLLGVDVPEDMDGHDLREDFSG